MGKENDFKLKSSTLTGNIDYKQLTDADLARYAEAQGLTLRQLKNNLYIDYLLNVMRKQPNNLTISGNTGSR